uniref:Uncharacterized protein n=1 Tax=Glossina palpalis gambiensis TaxID=67801 RepID=A0A1B0AMS0_9MUSC
MYSYSYSSNVLYLLCYFRIQVSSESNLVCSCCYNRSPTSLTTGSNSPDNSERAGLSPLSGRSSRWDREKCKHNYLFIFLNTIHKTSSLLANL